MNPIAQHPYHIRDITLDDIPALANLTINSMQETFRGIVPDTALQFTEAESAANWLKFLGGEGLGDRDFLVVAQAEDGQIVGYAWGGPSVDEREYVETSVYAGELRQIATLPAYQRRGVGRILVRYVAARLSEQGIHSLRVEVLRENPNREFYERMGGQYIGQRPYDFDGIPMVMYCYGWKDTRSLYEAP